jgi:hypothetical protein
MAHAPPRAATADAGGGAVFEVGCGGGVLPEQATARINHE